MILLAVTIVQLVERLSDKQMARVRILASVGF